MTGHQKQTFIRKRSREHIPEENERIMWSVHAIKKLRIEGFGTAEIEKCLKQCITIEDYPVQNRPLPDCLVLGFVGADPVHVVTALDEDFDRIFIVTVYRPTSERWEDGWKKRKR